MDFFDRLLLAALVCLLAIAFIRIVSLARRKIKVFAADRQRTLTQMLADVVGIVSGTLLGLAIISHGTGWFDAVPAGLDIPLIEGLAAKILGAAFLAVSLMFYALALARLDESFRIGIDRKKQGPLVTAGIYSMTRNPIYVSLDLFAIGSFLVNGRMIFLILAAAIVTVIHQTILREERFLQQEFDQSYGEYRSKVGRYISVKKAKFRV